MMSPGIPRSSAGALAALLAANLLPLVGVLYLGWRLFDVLFLYWVENGVIGLYNAAKMEIIARTEREGERDGAGGGQEPAPAQARRSRKKRPRKQAVSESSAPFNELHFFAFHYGMFWLVHGLFLFVFFGLGLFSQGERVRFAELPWGASGVMAVSHGISFTYNFLGRGEYRRTTVSDQMFAPYGRVLVMHVTILLGAVAVEWMGQPIASLALLVALKTAVDVWAHLREHNRLAAEQSAA